MMFDNDLSDGHFFKCKPSCMRVLEEFVSHSRWLFFSQISGAFVAFVGTKY